MKRFFILLLGLLIGISVYLSIPTRVLALQYDLVAPTGQLTRGQDVQFTITVNTEGQSVPSTEIGMSYQTDVLQYVSVAPGDAFPTVTASDQGGGKLLLNASNPNGFNGTGTFAVVTFKLIATASGRTDICVLFAPSPTPESPTGAPIQPTALPRTGSVGQTDKGTVIGASLLVLAAAGLVAVNRKPYKQPHKTHHPKSLH